MGHLSMDSVRITTQHLDALFLVYLTEYHREWRQSSFMEFEHLIKSRQRQPDQEAS
jgi:hypothetical protein